MQIVYLFLCCLFASMAYAQETNDLRLIQAEANLPTLHLWANLPVADGIEPEQFSVSIGSNSAKVFGVNSFAETNEGVGYIFLVDISKSLNSRQLVHIKRALRRWLENMGEHDQAALITFGHGVNESVEFTTDYFRLNNAINLLAITDMETSLYHGLLEAISLGRRHTDNLPLRRAIVMLSDGIDDSVSGVQEREVFRQSQEYRVPIYSIGFALPPINDRKREGLRVLSVLSRQTGGYFIQVDGSQIDRAYQLLHQQIIQAYRLRIDCPNCVADGQLQHIDVTWSNGQRSLNDSMEMRLLPKSKVNKPHAVEEDVEQSWTILILAIGILIFLLGFVFVIRQRLAHSTKVNAVDSASDPTIEIPLAPSFQNQAIPLKLTIVTGLEKGKIYHLQLVERLAIGRAANCDLILDDDVEISAQHAVLVQLNGKVKLRDLNSTNGSLVNGVPTHNDYPLRSGDLLVFGRTELRIEFPGRD